MQEQEGHTQQKSTKEERSLAVNFLQKALGALGLGSGLTEKDLDIVVKPLVDKEHFYVGYDDDYHMNFLDWMDQLRAAQGCRLCARQPL